jgi:hypothetical protein
MRVEGLACRSLRLGLPREKFRLPSELVGFRFSWRFRFAAHNMQIPTPAQWGRQASPPELRPACFVGGWRWGGGGGWQCVPLGGKVVVEEHQTNSC